MNAKAKLTARAVLLCDAKRDVGAELLASVREMKTGKIGHIHVLPLDCPEIRRMALRKLKSVHPGDILAHDFMKPLELSAYNLAKDLGVSVPTVNEIVRRRRAVTAEMALRLSRYFGTTAQLWQNLQAQYDLEVASVKMGKAAAKIKVHPSVKAGPRRAPSSFRAVDSDK